MATVSSIISLSTPRPLARLGSEILKDQHAVGVRLGQQEQRPWRRGGTCRLVAVVGPVRAAGPDKLSEKVVESVKQAEEACSEDPKSGECVAAWDEVEELSAAASHARDRKKESDPLEDFCKDNPENEECRTYDN